MESGEKGRGTEDGDRVGDGVSIVVPASSSIKGEEVSVVVGVVAGEVVVDGNAVGKITEVSVAASSFGDSVVGIGTLVDGGADEVKGGGTVVVVVVTEDGAAVFVEVDIVGSNDVDTVESMDGIVVGGDISGCGTTVGIAVGSSLARVMVEVVEGTKDGFAVVEAKDVIMDGTWVGARDMAVVGMVVGSVDG